MKILKKISDSIDRFCARHPGFGIPNIMLYIVIGNVLAQILMMMDTQNLLYSAIRFAPQLVLKGQLWRIVTFIFVPWNSGGLWGFLVLYFYYLAGKSLEQVWGSARLCLYLLSGVLLTAALSLICYVVFHLSFETNFYNICFSLYMVMAVLFPDAGARLFFIIPFKLSWFGWIVGLLIFWDVLSPLGAYHVINPVPLAALINFFLFCGGYLSRSAMPGGIRGVKRSAEYRKKVNDIKKKQAQSMYLRKCEICGKTDTQYPELEFRYCSRCDGNHCYCSEHIGNHIHYKD